MASFTKSMAGLAGAVLVVGSTGSWAQETTSPEWFAYGPGMMGWGGGWYGMILGPFFMILVLAAVIALVVLLVRWLGGPWQGATLQMPEPPRRTPIEILRERFARGEIDKEEFEERRRLLGD